MELQKVSDNIHHYVTVYSTDNADYGRLYFRKSDANSVSMGETDDGDWLGNIKYLGVNNAGAFTGGGQMTVQQSGDSAAYVPARMKFTTYSAAGGENTDQFVLIDDGGAGFGTATPEGGSGNLTVTDDYHVNTVGFSDTGPECGACLVGTSSIAGSTYTTLQDVLNTCLSAGRITGGEITDGGGGTVNVAAGTGRVKISDSQVDIIKFFDWDASAGVALDDDDLNYIYVDYNVGTEAVTIQTSTSIGSINGRTQIVIGQVYRRDGVVEILENGVDLPDYYADEWHRLEHYGLRKVTGSVVAESGTRYLTVTEGIYYRNIKEITTAAIDTTGAATFDAVYRDGAGGWTYTSLSQFSNIHYDDGDGTPGDVGVAKYATYYVYQCFEGDIYLQYGQSSTNTLAIARNEGVPTPPNYLAEAAILLAKIIIQNGDTNATEVTNYTTPALAASVSNHNELAGLDGGTAGEYYHFTSAEHTELSAWLDNVTLGSDGETLIDRDVTGAVTEACISSVGELTSTTSNTTMQHFWADMNLGSSYQTAGTQIKKGFVAENHMRHNQTGGDTEDYGFHADMGSIAELPLDVWAVDYLIVGAKLERNFINVGSGAGGSWNDVTAIGLKLTGWKHAGDLFDGVAGTFTRYAIYSDGGDVEFADGNIATTGTLGAGVTTLSGNLVMGDNSVTGIDTLTFTDVNGTIAGIQNQNLVDKSASETIAGAWTMDLLTLGGNLVAADNSITGLDTLTFTDVNGTIAGIQNQNLVDKSASETIAGAWTMDLLTLGGNLVAADNSITGLDTLTFTDVNGTIAGIQNQNLVDKSAAETISGLWTFDKVPTGAGVGQGSLYVNPASATGDYTLFGVALNGSERFRVDEDGDVFVGADLHLGGDNRQITLGADGATDSYISFDGDDLVLLSARAIILTTATEVECTAALSVTTTLDVAGLATFDKVPTGAGVGQGSVYINPASAVADRTLFGVALNGAERFRVDAEGDTTVVGDLAVTGTVTAAHRGARVYNNAAITIGTGAPVTVVTFNSERFDTDAFHDTSSNTNRLTVPEAGLYYVSATVRWEGHATGRRQIFIAEGSTGTAVVGSTTTPANASVVLQSCGGIWEAPADGWFQFSVFQSSGGDLDLTLSAATSPEFMIVKLN